MINYKAFLKSEYNKLKNKNEYLSKIKLLGIKLPDLEINNKEFFSNLINSQITNFDFKCICCPIYFHSVEIDGFEILTKLYIKPISVSFAFAGESFLINNYHEYARDNKLNDYTIKAIDLQVINQIHILLNKKYKFKNIDEPFNQKFKKLLILK